MRRTVLFTVVIALLAAAGALAPGCGKRTAAAGANDTARASSRPATWTKVVELGGSLSSARRGRSSVTIELTGNALRFDVTYGPAPGWGADHVRLRWWLYPVTDSRVPLAAVPLHVVAKKHWGENDSTTLRLETVESLSPGSYGFLYRGSGWYNLLAYQR